MRSAHQLLRYPSFYRLLSSRSAITSSNSKTAEAITNAFSLQNLKLLDGISVSGFKPDQVEPVLYRLHSQPDAALRFFDWSENIVGLPHTLQAYCTLVHLLLSRRMFDPARLVVGRMICQFLNADDILNVLAAGFRIFGSNPRTVYSFLVECYARAGMVDQSANIFLRMYASKIPVAPYASSGLLKYFLASGQIDFVLENFQAFVDGLVGGYVSVYSAVVEALLGKGEFEKVVNFHRDIVMKGFVLHVSACNKILNNLCKGHGIIVARDFLKNAIELHEHMLQSDISPNIVSYSILIDGLCKEGRVEDATLAFRCAIERGLVPDLAAYSILIHAYCKSGNFVEAKKLYSRMVADGVKPDELMNRIIPVVLQQEDIVGEGNERR
ncbi:hypothetical protein H6P81_005908 [Aristolochia fimbriata]|uniref:Pentatricopeptide repeat-containing protein n=1 Tax=Aristolochia fimbriata TaxID=158543 RepID=A0AAV7EWY6_ARIFI|nr:hypothetical protein H6P81_005908 [Aristolochia fimbriata]